MTTRPKIDAEKLLEEINEFDTHEIAAIAMDCIVQEFALCPQWIALNYSRLLFRGSDRLVEIFEEELLFLTSEQRRWLFPQLIAQLWP